MRRSGPLLALLAVALVAFAVRGPLRLLRGGSDLAVVQAAAATWVYGGDPYDPEQIGRSLTRQGYPSHEGSARSPEMLAVLYPPSTWLVVAPLVPLPWPFVRWAWLGLCGAAIAWLGALVWGIRRSLNPAGSAAEACVLAAFLLAAAPLHTAVAKGQLSLLAIVLVVAAFHTSEARRGIASGVLGGVAFALKPQLGIIALAYYACRGRGRELSIGVLCAALLGIGGAARLWLAAPPPEWVEGLWHNLLAFHVGGFGDATRGAPYAYHSISLHLLLHRLTDSRALVQVAAIAAGAIVTGVSVWRTRGRDDPRSGLLVASVLAVTCLLSATHKLYDALVLMLPAVWLVDRVRMRGLSAGSVAMGLALLSFLVPGQAAVWVWTESGVLPAAVTNHPLWDALVVPQHVWALLAIQALLLAALPAARRGGLRRARSRAAGLPRTGSGRGSSDPPA